jgi:hypothetical protein
MMKFGVHTGPQNCSYEDLRCAWRLAEESETAAKKKRAGLEQQVGDFPLMVEPGMLVGAPQQVIDRVLPAFAEPGS